MNQEKYKYNSWPLGKVPEELQRLEPKLIKEKGYDWKDPRDIVDIFEQKIAAFAGCRYAVLTDCCSHGIFLSLKYLQSKDELKEGSVITIPRRTYVSVPMQIQYAGNKVDFDDTEWTGLYKLGETRVWDSAVRWTKNMYRGEKSLQVVSFQIKKRLPIGKGGVILTDDYNAAKWLKLASYDGRDLTSPYTDSDHLKMFGYHYYMTPEDAARGILLMDSTPEVNEDSGNYTMYPDVSKYDLFNNKK